MALIECKECGKEISENAVSCPNCGAKNRNNNETASIGLKIICFLIPLIGIIIFAVNISIRPRYAKGCLIASLLPTIIIIIFVASFYITSDSGILTKTTNSSVNVNTNNSVNSSTYLPYCKYRGCYNKVEYSWKEYCERHSYLED